MAEGSFRWRGVWTAAPSPVYRGGHVVLDADGTHAWVAVVASPRRDVPGGKSGSWARLGVVELGAALADLDAGEWSALTSYGKGVLVTHKGSTYIARKDTVHQEPPDAEFWLLFAKAGDPGAKGDKGDQGIPGVKGDTGKDGPAGKQGDKGPKGDPGIQGVKGDPGVKGDTGPDGAQGKTGDKGATGAKGDTGVQGPVGPQGPKGDKGDAGDKFHWKGPWELGTKYTVLDSVSNGGSSYQCTVSHTARADDEPGAGRDWKRNWDLMAAKGDRGDKGDQGEQGPAAAQGPPGPGLRAKGQWKAQPASSAERYDFNDLVFNKGSQYRCTLRHRPEPSDEPGVGAQAGKYWELFVAQGVQGDAGLGPKGGYHPPPYVRDEVVLWGGSSYYCDRDTGGDARYDLLAGDWRAMFAEPGVDIGRWAGEYVAGRQYLADDVVYWGAGSKPETRLKIARRDSRKAPQEQRSDDWAPYVDRDKVQPRAYKQDSTPPSLDWAKGDVILRSGQLWQPRPARPATVKTKLQDWPWSVFAVRGDQGENPGYDWRNGWVSGAEYDERDLSHHEGDVYVALKAHTASPDTAPGNGGAWPQYWNMFAAQGPQGVQGVQGVKGDRGADGASGVQGPRGPQGPQGVQGDRGPQGSQGTQGSQGPKGDGGIQGPQGAKGDRGLEGAPGVSGVHYKFKFDYLKEGEEDVLWFDGDNSTATSHAVRDSLTLKVPGLWLVSAYFKINTNFSASENFTVTSWARWTGDDDGAGSSSQPTSDYGAASKDKSFKAYHSFTRFFEKPVVLSFICESANNRGLPASVDGEVAVVLVMESE